MKTEDKNALKLANEFSRRAKKKFDDAACENDQFAKRLLEHGATCYANAAFEIRNAFGLPPNA